jgi:hypothetical protein
MTTKWCPRCQREKWTRLGPSDDLDLCDSDRLCDLIAHAYSHGMIAGHTIAMDNAGPIVRGRSPDDDSVDWTESEAELRRELEACK